MVYGTLGGATLDASFVAVRRNGGHVVSSLPVLSSKRFNFAAGNAALDLVESGRSAGKVIVDVS